MAFQYNPFTGNLDLSGAGGSGNVVGPDGGSTDNAIARFDGTTGRIIQNSAATIDDSGSINTTGDVTGDTVNATDIQTATLTATGDVDLGGTIATALTAQKAIVTDSSGNLAASSTTATQVGYISTLSSNAQDQLDSKIPLIQKGAALGVATLDGGGKIPSAQLPSSVMDYKGNWDASTNTPTLANGVGDAGDVYRANVAGSTDFGAGAITFAIGDWAVYNGTIWEKSLNSNSVVSVNGFTGMVVLDSGDITEDTNLYFTDERAQDAVGTILVDTASVDLTYNDGTPSITATVLPAGVDHDQLQNFSANKHVDHTSVSIATASATSGLAGGGDISTTRNLSVDINGTTSETSIASGDKVLIYDVSAGALRSMTRSNLFASTPVSSAGDINEISFSGADNQSSAADITGLAFANGTVRSFKAEVSVVIDATSDLFEKFELNGVQKGSTWEMSQSSVGDNSGVVLSITNSGQVQYTSPSSAGFVSLTMKARAITTSV